MAKGKNTGDFFLYVNDRNLIPYFLENWWISSFNYFGFYDKNFRLEGFDGEQSGGMVVYLYLINIPSEPKDCLENIMKTEGVVDIRKKGSQTHGS